MEIKAILFDVIGTTALERDPLTITNCFQQAFNSHGIPVTTETIYAYRGKDKREAITGILDQVHQPSHLSELVLASFNSNIRQSLVNFYENPTLSETIYALRKMNVVIGVGSGLPDDIFQLIFSHLKWSSYAFDYIGSSEKIGRGRPHPDLIFDMMRTKNISASDFVKVGDTIADIQEGKNAGVTTVALLSGTTKKSDLQKANPDFIIDTLTELIPITQKIKKK